MDFQKTLNALEKYIVFRHDSLIKKRDTMWELTDHQLNRELALFHANSEHNSFSHYPDSYFRNMVSTWAGYSAPFTVIDQNYIEAMLLAAIWYKEFFIPKGHVDGDISWLVDEYKRRLLDDIIFSPVMADFIRRVLFRLPTHTVLNLLRMTGFLYRRKSDNQSYSNKGNNNG